MGTSSSLQYFVQTFSFPRHTFPLGSWQPTSYCPEMPLALLRNSLEPSVIFTKYIYQSSKCLWIIFPTRLEVPWKLRLFLTFFFCICDSASHSVKPSKPGWNAFKVFCASEWSWKASDFTWKDLREEKVKSRVVIRVKFKLLSQDGIQGSQNHTYLPHIFHLSPPLQQTPTWFAPFSMALYFIVLFWI